eukprot:1518460-Rhodomonas_salina.1
MRNFERKERADGYGKKNSRDGAFIAEQGCQLAVSSAPIEPILFGGFVRMRCQVGCDKRVINKKLQLF